jgi:hypothetical protein
MYTSPDCTGSEYAASATAYADNYYSDDTAPSKAIDGNTGTRWAQQTDYEINVKWWVDLGVARPINSIAVLNYVTNQYTFKSVELIASADAVNWTVIYGPTAFSPPSRWCYFYDIQAGSVEVETQTVMPNFQRDIIHLYGHYDATATLASQQIKFTQYPITIETGTSETVSLLTQGLTFTQHDVLPIGNSHTDVLRQDMQFSLYPVTVTSETSETVTLASQLIEFIQHPVEISVGATVTAETQELVFIQDTVAVITEVDATVSIPQQALGFELHPLSSVSGDVNEGTDTQELTFTQHDVSVRVDVRPVAATQEMLFTVHPVSVESQEGISAPISGGTVTFTQHDITVNTSVLAGIEYAV